MRVTPEMIASLRGKYREIKRLRDEHAAHASGPGVLGEARDPKRDMAALARRFPGALRELDELPMAVVEARLAALDLAIAASTVPQWAALQLGYHGTFRAVLRIKRSAGRLRDLSALEAALDDLRAQAHDDEPIWADLDPRSLASIVRPAGGRLHPWVLAHVARIFGVSSATVAQSLYLRERDLTTDVPNPGPKS